MRVNMFYLNYSPERLYNLLQAYQPCWIFTPDMHTWMVQHVPNLLIVIPYDPLQDTVTDVEFTPELR